MRRLFTAAALVLFGTLGPSPAYSGGLQFSSRAVNFGKVIYKGGLADPPSSSRNLTISNPPGQPLVSGFNFTLSGASSIDFKTDTVCPADLPAGTNCTLQMTFTPSRLASRRASIAFSDSHGARLGSANLSGVGIRPGKLIVPSSLSLGSVQLGQSVNGFIGISNPNPDGVTVDVDSISTSDTAFTESDNCVPSIPGESQCGIQVTFTPTKACSPNGMVSANLVVTSDAAPPQKVKLTATVTGIVQPQVFVANATTADTLVSPLMGYALPGAINTPSIFIGSIDATFNPADVALNSSGQVLVANNSSPFFGQDNVGSIQVFSPCTDGTAQPDASIVGGNTGLEIPTGVAVDSHGKIYVTNSSNADFSSGRVTVYAAGSHDNASPLATIEGPDTGLSDPRDIAIDSKGNIYVVNDGNTSVTIYAPGSDGDSAPIATIAGPSTGLDIPDAIGIDRKGVIYIANEAGGPAFFGSIALFPPLGKNRGPLDIPPTAVISGTNGSPDNTGLNLPLGVALDSNSNIYVTNFFGGDSEAGSVTVYSPVGNVSGVLNAAPINTITGFDSMIANPTGIAIGKIPAHH